MRFFITGGAGFIGSVLTNKLLSHGNKVSVFDNFSLGRREFLDTGNKNLKIIKGDVRNFNTINKSMKGHNFVYHLAANSDILGGLKNSKLDFEINTLGTLNVLESMISNKIKNLVFASTSAVFGYPTKFPTREDYGPSLPDSYYGASKLAGEGYVSAYSKLYKLKSWIFRFANITGSPATHGIIYDFVNKLNTNSEKFVVLGDGHQRKSYITNEMLVDAILKIVKKTIKKNHNVLLYNVGNYDDISVANIAKIFLKENCSKKRIAYTGGHGGWIGDVPKMRLDVKKITKDGWHPDKTSKECIMQAIRSYLS